MRSIEPLRSFALVVPWTTTTTTTSSTIVTTTINCQSPSGQRTSPSARIFAPNTGTRFDSPCPERKASATSDRMCVLLCFTDISCAAAAFSEAKKECIFYSEEEVTASTKIIDSDYDLYVLNTL